MSVTGHGPQDMRPMSWPGVGIGVERLQSMREGMKGREGVVHVVSQ